MTIELYVRSMTNKYVRPLIIKEECEKCGEIVGLELHHIIPFSQLLEKCLNKLNYKYYKNKEEYSKDELENIINWMLGVQLKIKYMTVCKKCHIDVHNEKHKGFSKVNDGYKKYREAEKEINELEKIQKTKDIIIPYLDSIVGVKLFIEQQKYLCNILKDIKVINSKYHIRGETINPANLRAIINDELKLEYEISDSKQETKKENRQKRYIIINKQTT